jgi:monoamine oxidase
MFTENTALTFLDRNPQTGLFDLVEHDMISKGGQARHRQPASFAPADGGHVVIIGAGIGGLTVAYDLLKQNQHRPADKHFRVTVLEAMGRVGGRSITLRPGNPNRPTPEDSFTEDFIDQSGNRQVVTQTCTFEHESGQPYQPYLNAGPGRIPSGHIQLLHLCQELGVELELYVMETRSNVVVTKSEGSGGVVFERRVNRQVVNDIRGYLAEELYERMAPKPDSCTPDPDPTRDNLLQLLRYFGALSKDREDKYAYKGSQRAGYATLPGTNAGVLLEPLDKDELINAKLWERSVYQAEDFLWQQTSFQPVGGMDMIEKVLARRIRELARISQPGLDPIKLESPVARIQKTRQNQWIVTYTGSNTPVVADFCVVNMPIPLLQDKLLEQDFSREYWKSLNKVMTAKGFLRPTCKVGWQAERKLWQEPADQNSVAIYGGISRVDHPMTQMWYPSDQWYARLGVLTGAYNYEDQAERWGKMLPKDRVDEARTGAKLLHGEAFGDELKHGISIAWQNLPYLRGGWADWEFVSDDPDERVRIMNAVREGENNFYIVGDQVSALPGWKEGAVATALEVFGRVCMIQGYMLPEMARVPDTRALTEGYSY